MSLLTGQGNNRYSDTYLHSFAGTPPTGGKGLELIDFHCHILPELDDGAKNWQESLRMAKMALDDGVAGIVCTPHLTPVFPENNRAMVLASVEQLRIRLLEAGIPIELYPGSELAIDSSLAERIESDEVMTVNDNRSFALIEMPVDFIPPNLGRFFWNMQSSGIGIVLAHPERNLHLIDHPSMLYKWVAGGVMIQITASSLEGYLGRRVRKFSLNLLEQQMVHLVASDSHGPARRRPVLSAARTVVESVIGKEQAHKIFYEYPKQILSGIEPDCAPPIQAQKKANRLRNIFNFLK